MADARRIMAAAQRAVDAKRAGNQVVMVISARGDKTDELIDLAKQIGIDGTPAFIVGTRMIAGAAELGELQRAVAEVRAGR